MNKQNKGVLALAVFFLFCLWQPYAKADDGMEERFMTIPVGDLNILSIRDADGTMESSLLPELYKYPELKGYFAHGPLPSVCNVYYFENGGHRVLVDSGWGSGQGVKGHAVEALAARGIEPASITDILLTHLDSDHIGGLTSGDEAVFPNATLHVSAPEWDAWQKGNVQRRTPDKIDRARKLAGIYRDRIKTFQFGAEVLPGVKAVNAIGHTPGHTAFDIVSGKDKLTIAGDLIHIAKVQLMRPELSSLYDMDMPEAARARQRLLEEAAKDGREFAGMHFDAVSPVKAIPSGGFAMREAR